MLKKPLNINVSGKAKYILEKLHSKENKSYSDIIFQLYKNSPNPIDIINNIIEELKIKIGNDDLNENIERIRVIILKCYRNQKEYEKINSILDNAMKEIGELEPEVEEILTKSPNSYSKIDKGGIK